ncbi:hypothetical protein KPH14_002067 [Odynerus spinipes]|uniref:Uncharacterized protein n=1 Tax=Odynerus spinipes TaxID=1348599 RepID=A0AAD9VMC6_9HYME|nr:hypothetical protein KPH14_002067 [Odynerus spinipes]
MPVDKKKRSRSPSESRPRSKKSHHKNKNDKRFDKLQDQVSNLTKVVEALLESKKEKIPTQPVIDDSDVQQLPGNKK